MFRFIHLQANIFWWAAVALLFSNALSRHSLTIISVYVCQCASMFASMCASVHVYRLQFEASGQGAKWLIVKRGSCHEMWVFQWRSDWWIPIAAETSMQALYK